jgi:hypothetical protein
MNCFDAEQFFDAYLDGELSSSLRLELDAHRLRCPRCQQTLAMLESCQHIIATDSRQPAMSEDFTDRVMAGVAVSAAQAAPARLGRIYKLSLIAAPVAAAIALVAALPWLWNPKVVEPQPIMEVHMVPVDQTFGLPQPYRAGIEAIKDLPGDVSLLAEYGLRARAPEGVAEAAANPLPSILRAGFPIAPDEPTSSADLEGPPAEGHAYPL